MNRLHGTLSALLCALTLMGCGAGMGTWDWTVPGSNLGGTVTGLTGTGLTLQTNGMPQVPVDRLDNGFHPALGGWFASGTAYDITVLSQPINPSQTCLVTNGVGTASSADITNIAVKCTINPSRFVYVANGGSNSISAYSIDASSGVLTPISGSPYPVGKAPSSIAVDPLGHFAYVSNQADGDVSGFAIDRVSGALTAVSGSLFPSRLGPSSVAVDPSSTFVYVANANSNNVSAYAVDRNDGVLTPVVGSPFAAGTGPSFDAMSGALTAVPGSPFTAGSLPDAIAVSQ
jgi:6-phosphogluconolactonase